MFPFLRKLSGALAIFALFSCFTEPSVAYCPKKLRIGLVPSENSQELMRKAQPLISLMRASLGMDVEARPASDYTSVVEAMRAGKLDLAFLAPGGFLMAERQAGAKVILKSVRKGKAFFYSAIITQRDSDLTKIKDLKDRSFAFVDSTSVSGSIYPKSLLLSEGINPERDFSRVIYAGGHDATVLAVLNKTVDAGATFANDTTGKNGAWTDFLKDKKDQDQIRVIAYTEPIPSDNICVSRELDPALVNRIKRFFLNPEKAKPQQKTAANQPRTGDNRKTEVARILKELYHIDGYVEASSADYEPVRKAFESVGIKIR